MEHFEKIRRFENLHILLWLIKDTCWMLEFKTIGAIMVVPTISMALYIVLKTKHVRDVFINLAVFSWISANAFWMLMEFFFNNRYKYFSIIPFAFGFLFVALYYLKPDYKKKS